MTSSVRLRVTREPATWSAWAGRTSLRCVPTWPCSRNLASTSSWSVTRPPVGSGQRRASRTSPSLPTSPVAGMATGTRRPWPSVCRTPRRGPPAPAVRRGCARRATRLCRRSRLGGRQPRRRRRCGPGGRSMVDVPRRHRRRRLAGRAQRAQILLIDPGRPVGPGPCLLRSGFAAVRAHRGDRPAAGRQLSFRPRVVRAGRLPRAGERRRVGRSGAQVRPPLPGPRRRRAHLFYAGCYDVTPDYNPVIGPSPVEGLWLSRGSPDTATRSPPRWVKLMADLMIHGHSRLSGVLPSALPLGSGSEKSNSSRAEPANIRAGQMR